VWFFILVLERKCWTVSSRSCRLLGRLSANKDSIGLGVFGLLDSMKESSYYMKIGCTIGGLAFEMVTLNAVTKH